MAVAFSSFGAMEPPLRMLSDRPRSGCSTLADGDLSDVGMWALELPGDMK